MRQQKRPFTVTVKRRKGGASRVGTAFGGLSASFADEAARMAADEAEERRWPDVLPGFSELGESEPRQAKRAASGRRQPRILDAPAPQVAATPEPDPTYGRPRGRPRRKDVPDAAAGNDPERPREPKPSVAGKPQDQTSPRLNASPAPSAPPPPSRAPAVPAARPPVAGHVNDAAPAPSGGGETEGASGPADRWRRRRSPEPAGLKLGHRWKRHLPRWKR